MKIISLTFLMLLLCQSAFSQSKKEQIDILIFQNDSLGKILALERQLNTDQVKQLEAKITKINSDKGLILKELAQSKKDLTAKEEEIEKFRVGQVLWEDTIRSLREELHQIKSSNSNYEYYILSTSTIGKSVRIGNLEVAQFDFPDSMTRDEAVKACASLGHGWRLPTHDELDILYQNAEKMGNFFHSYYWSSTGGGGYGYVWYVGFTLGNQPFYNEFTPVYVRAVRDY